METGEKNRRDVKDVLSPVMFEMPVVQETDDGKNANSRKMS